MQYTFFCVQNINKRRIYLSLFDIFLVNSTPREFAYIWQSEQVAIIARAEVSNNAKSLFSDVFASVTLLVSYKLPNIPQGTPSSTPLFCSSFLNLCLFPKSKMANTNTQPTECSFARKILRRRWKILC